MSDTKRPPRCDYSREFNMRVTREHRDDCPNPADHRGCAPCTAPHCLVCGRAHASNDHPDTCPTCISKIRQDLASIRSSYAALATEALAAGNDGKLIAAAPIPGGDAQVLIGPTVRLDMLRTFRKYSNADWVRSDPLPPLAVLAQWEDIWRTWLHHPIKKRATLGAAITYLDQQLDYAASHATTQGAPDWIQFTRQIRKLRASLEDALHDERDPERGVECFECGGTLVRRFRTARRCRHSTKARRKLEQALRRQQEGQVWLRTLGTYPELGPPSRRDTNRATPPPRSLIAEARQPCARCAGHQGGIANPSAGQSWECPDCRKHYDPGEYATAVKRDLLDRNDDELGWCTLQIAADAAADMTKRPISVRTIRTWIERGDPIGIACFWKPGQRVGVQMVFWPDVLERASEQRGRRARKAS